MKLVALLSAFLPLLNFLQYCILQSFWLRRARPPPHHFPVAIDEELLKIPFDALQTHEPRFLALHPLPHWLGVVSVDVGLAQDGEGDTVVELTETLDLLVGAGVLGQELVAGETQDLELVRVLGLDLLVERFQAGVLGGEAALGGGVDRQHHLALVL